MRDLTPLEAERALAWERLVPEELPDLAAGWLVDGYDTPALRELAGHQFLDVVHEIDRALGPETAALDDDTVQLLHHLWSALKSASGERIEGLLPQEEALVVRAYGQYSESRESFPAASERREAEADAVAALRELAQAVAQGRAARVLDALLAQLPRSSVTESRSVTVVDSWCVPPSTVCVVYRFPGYPCAIGLCRELEADTPDLSLVADIVDFEIGEPLGTVFDEAYVGPDNVFWWDGVRAIPPRDAPRRPSVRP